MGIQLQKICFKICFVISCCSSVFLFCINDISPNGLLRYILFSIFSVASIVTTILFYNYRLIARHLFAIQCLIMITYGSILKKRSIIYRFLYNVALRANSVKGFYIFMIYLYDYVNRNIVTVSDSYKAED